MLSLGDVNKQFYVLDNELYRKNTNGLAGGIRPDGYKTVSIFNKRYLVHRILYMFYHNLDYADLPKAIDHINGNPSDNSIKNLRACPTNVHNLYNSKSSRKYKGVSRNGIKYRAQIMVNRKMIHLGMFTTELEAANAYNKAAQAHFGEYARLNTIW